VSHLVNAPEKILDHFMRLIDAFEHISDVNDVAERLSKEPSDVKTNSLLKRFKRYKGVSYIM